MHVGVEGGFVERRSRSPVTSRQRALLGVDHLQMRYPDQDHLALQDISFDLHAGEFMAVVGPSGCGKTTLLRIIAGLLRPTGGRVLLRDKAVEAPDPEMVLVFQDYSRSLFPWLTVERSVLFPLQHQRDISKANKRARVAQALADVGLEKFEKHYPWQLSGGMQQRVAIARALAFRPSILLLDEPFASVDALTREGLEDLILEIRSRESHARDTTVILVTHDIGEAVYLSDRVLVLGAPPSIVHADIPVPLERPRDQITTRADARFLRMSEEIHSLIGVRRPAGSDERTEAPPEKATAKLGSER